MDLLTHFSQEKPFDLSQKAPGLHLSQSDGESVPGSSCQEEDEESLYRRSQYSPEVDQHEPAGEDQYIPELEETGQGSPDELRPGKKPKQMYQQSLDGETLERESAAEESVDPRDDQASLSQSKTTYESDVELSEQAYQHEATGRQMYEYDSDSELEDQELDEQSRQQLIGVYEPAVDVAERNQSRLETGKVVHRMQASEFTGSHEEDEDEDEEDKE